MRSRYADNPTYITRDGSSIRELMHPGVHGNAHQSLAEAMLEPATETRLHRHSDSEELYHVLAGCGEMTLADRTFSLQPGDTVCIPPRTAHKIRNTGTEPLRFLCMCAPPYAHEDTELLD